MTQQDIDTVFLALMIYREARGAGPVAQVAVAYTALTRAKYGGWWGTDVMSVLFKKWQYTSMSGDGDPQLTVWPHSNEPAWQQCLKSAQEAVLGTAPNPAPRADSYFDLSIAAPSWAQPANFVIQIGRLKFYRTIAT